MLKAANTSIEAAMRLFNGAGIAVGLLVPSKAQYEKSLMDATFSFRDFLKNEGIHEYSKQGQGQENKVLIHARFVLPDRYIESKASLYRPITKHGDPRIWFSDLKKYCKPTDLLAILYHDDIMYVLNMSNIELVNSFAIPGSYPHELLYACSEIISPTAAELLRKLKEIHNLDFIKGISHGDTNVGMTLENLLGIPPNSSKTPDYKGIELKSSRKHSDGTRITPSGKTQHITLFTQVPDWKRSKFSAEDILKIFGYSSDRYSLQLNCTISNVPNAQGLYLDASNEIDLINKAKHEKYTGDVVVWALEKLKERLESKHAETFWVQATSKIIDGCEFFRYDLVRHTRKPNTANIASMFDAGIITVDFAMHIKPTGGIRDHGYLFRTSRSNFSHIFPLEKIYDLSSLNL